MRQISLIFALIGIIGTTDVTSLIESEESLNRKITRTFPNNFSFGASTAAYQIEGAWNEDGKGMSIWDTLTHNHPELIADHLTADVGPDSYHYYKDDIEALKQVGFEHYRFSISWSRILPNGSAVNEQAINYYNQLIDELIINNIEPVVTMYHYDMPQYLQDIGGFTNPLFVNYFEVFAGVLYKNFGSRVKLWITFNEPFDTCVDGYGTGISAPLISVPGVGEYLCAHYLLEAHAVAYHLYKDKYYQDFRGLVGISLNSRFYYPKDSSVGKDVIQRAMEYRLGWFANPIFGKDGDYPKIMIQEIAKSSLKEGRQWSRLPVMSEALRASIHGSSDFFGFNYYTSRLVELKKDDSEPLEPPSWDKDSKLQTTPDPKWLQAKSDWLYSVPQGLEDVLVWIKDNYESPAIFITENGWSDDGQHEDTGRIEYITSHLAAISNAINEHKCNIMGYTVWSIIDNFEWLRGYTEKFGMFSVNLESATKERSPKKSVQFMKEVIANKFVSF